MKVTNPNLASLASSEAARTNEVLSAGRSSTAQAAGSPSGDDVHLSELVRSLRALAGDSPETQARVEQLARAYATGSYQVDPESLAGRVIDDAIAYS